MKAALLVIDIQNEFFNISQVCTDSLKSAIQYVNAAIALFRKKNLPVIAVQHKSVEEDLVPGKPLVYGQSITDACIAWEESVPLLRNLADSVRRRRLVKSGES